jgi:2-polyprenyl-3-methyl-5-hydroxy-6-metoxy-1,4-benzoquinol methylase
MSWKKFGQFLAKTGGQIASGVGRAVSKGTKYVVKEIKSEVRHKQGLKEFEKMERRRLEYRNVAQKVRHEANESLNHELHEKKPDIFAFKGGTAEFVRGKQLI